MDKFEQQHLAAVKHADERRAFSPRAKRASFDRKARRLVVDLENGSTFIVPVSLIQILHNATDEQIADVKPKVHGLYLSWSELDEDLTLEHLMSGVFGTQSWMNDLKELRSGGKEASRPRGRTSKSA